MPTNNKTGLNVSELEEMLKSYAVINKKLIHADFGNATKASIDQFCTPITKVQGSYETYYAVMTHVVQGFSSEWTALGQMIIKDKELKNYRQKVNFDFKPADVLGTAAAIYYDEDKDLTAKQISKYVFDQIYSKTLSDVAYLSMKGIYDAAKAAGNFGYSVDGINTLIRKMQADTKHPCYKIPLEALTDTNIVDQLTVFERNIPEHSKEKVKIIHLSTNNLERYYLDYRNQFGLMPTYKDSDSYRSPLGSRQLVGHPNMADDIIFATIEDGGDSGSKNLLKLIDINNPAKITDIQKQDYSVKVFGEFCLGWDFLFNEAVFVANFEDDTAGLGNDELMALYYPDSQEVEVPEEEEQEDEPTPEPEPEP